MNDTNRERHESRTIRIANDDTNRERRNHDLAASRRACHNAAVMRFLLLTLVALSPALLLAQSDEDAAREHYAVCLAFEARGQVCDARQACDEAYAKAPLAFIKETLQSVRSRCRQAREAANAATHSLTVGALTGGRLCEAGRILSPDTAGHCCWPGQAWNGNQCKGLPERCPQPLTAEGEVCVAPACGLGKVLVDDIHCCWPEQAWSRLKSRCIGVPECPTGTFASGETCLQGSAIDGAPMQSIPAGRFLMGASDDEVQAAVELCQATHETPEWCDARELLAEAPQHSVYLEAFWLDRYEVSNALYELCVEAGSCSPRDTQACLHQRVWTGTRWRFERGPITPAWLDPAMPATCVRWQDARDYCAWAGKRLPTEAEWEKAARSDDARLFPWGHDWDPERAHFKDSHLDAPLAVEALSTDESPYGVLGLAGNVSEWTADPFSELELRRAVRGGHFRAGTQLLRASSRTERAPEELDATLGFRCAMSASEP